MRRFVMAILTAVLVGVCGLPAAQAGDKPVRALFVLAGSGGHNIEVNTPPLFKMIEQVGGIKVTLLAPPKGKPGDTAHIAKLAELKPGDIDVLVFYTVGGKLEPAAEQALQKFVEAGGGLVAIHGATASFGGSKTWFNLVGARFAGHAPGTYNLVIDITDKKHPITTGVAAFPVNDEEYTYKFAEGVKRHVIARFKERPPKSKEKTNNDVLWTIEVGKGRVFHCGLGHDVKAWSTPEFQKLILQGIHWAAGRPQRVKLSAARVDAYGQPLPTGAIARLGTGLFRLPGPVLFLAHAGPQLLVAATRDGDVRLWDLAAAKESRRWKLPTSRNLFEPGVGSPSLALSGDGTTMIWRDEKGNLVVADVVSGKELRRWTPQELEAKFKSDGRGTPTLSLSGDGKLLVLAELSNARFGTAGRQVGVWRVASGDFVGVMKVDKNLSLTACDLADDNGTLATLEGTPEGIKEKKGPDEAVVRLWNVATGQELRHFAVGKDRSRGLRFAPGGKTLAVVFDNSVRLFDAATGKEQRVFTLDGDTLRGVAFAPDGTRLFGHGERQVIVWDTKDGKEQRRFTLDAPTEDRRSGKQLLAPVALAQDGKTLAVGSGAGFRRWDVASGKELKQPDGHHNFVAALAFAPQGDRVLSATTDSPVRLWDAATGRLVRQFDFPADEGPQQRGFLTELTRMLISPVHVAFAPDGQTVAALKRGQALQRWDAGTGKRLPAWANAPRG